MKFYRKNGGSVGTIYVSHDGQWEIWREVYPPRLWYVNATHKADADHTEWAAGFRTKRDAVAALEKWLS